jgi:preprotein translocase subunit SecA
MLSAHQVVPVWLSSFMPGVPSVANTSSTVDQIRTASAMFKRKSDAELEQLGRQLAHAPNTALEDDQRVTAFGLVDRAIRRVHGIELFNVQLLAGALLAEGFVVEMQTGEGKTLSAALPAFLHGLAGTGVHVVTPNSYLAQRDYELLAPVYRMLGRSVGLLPEGVSLNEKEPAYQCDITYGTGYEFGFDFLREQAAKHTNTANTLGDYYAQLLKGANSGTAHIAPRRAVAIIDEIDSVLIDEACLPLVLNGEPKCASSNVIYQHALATAATLIPISDYRRFDSPPPVSSDPIGNYHRTCSRHCSVRGRSTSSKLCTHCTS